MWALNVFCSFFFMCESGNAFVVCCFTCALLPTPLHTTVHHCTTLHTTAGGHVYAIGGQSGKRCVASCEWLDPQSGVGWLLATGQLHTVRKYASAAVLSGRIHVVGGLNMQRTRLSDMEAYDPREGIWHCLPGMQQPRSSSGLASLGGKLYAGRELREGDFMRVDMVIY